MPAINLQAKVHTVLPGPARYTEPELFNGQIEDVTKDRNRSRTRWKGTIKLGSFERTRPGVEGEGDKYANEEIVHGGKTG
jgi:hypothetical protein